MKSFLRNSYFIILLSVLVKSVVVAQVNSYPVTGIVKVALPASISFEEYVNPITSPIDLGISLNDQRFPVRSVFLSLRIEGPAGTVVSFANRVSHQLISGYNPIPKAVVAACFSPDNLSNLPPAYLDKAMPAGIYTFSFRVIDALTGAALSLPISSAPVWIEASDPPVPVQPANYSALPASQVQNVIFQWLPRHTFNPNLEYELTLTELPATNRGVGNIQNVFLSQPPIVKTTTTQTNLLYDAKYPPLRQGAMYAWRVQVKPKFGVAPGKVSTFLYDGYSEVYSFLYDNIETKLNPPTNLQVAYSPDFYKMNSNWNGEDNHIKYIVSLVQDIPGNSDPSYSFEIEKGVDNSTAHSFKYTNKNSKAMNGVSDMIRYDYKILVSAVDVFGRKSEPAVYKLDAIDDAKRYEIENGITLKGKVEVIDRTYTPIPNDSIKVNVTGEKKRFTLSGIGITFIATDKPLKAKTYKEFINELKDLKSQKDSYLVGGSLSEEGIYAIPIRDVRWLYDNYKHYYLVVNGNSKIADFIMPIEIVEKAGNEREIPTITTVLNTVRLTPTFTAADGKVFEYSDFEDINVYAYQNQIIIGNDAVTKNAYLNAVSGTKRFNKQLLAKIGSLKEVNSSFPYTQNLVIGVQKKGEEERFFPWIIYPFTNCLTKTGDPNGNIMPEIKKAFMYSPPPIKISGHVAVRGEAGQPTIPIRSWEVGILILKNSWEYRDIDLSGKLQSAKDYESLHYEKVLTDTEGYYELELPESVYFNQDIRDLVIFNRVPEVYSFYQAKRIDKPSINIVVDINLVSSGTAIASVVKDQYGAPVVGAIVKHPETGAMTTTNQQGEFVLNVQFKQAVEREPYIQILADGYQYESDSTKFIDLTTFNKNRDSQEATDGGLGFWKTQIKNVQALTGSSFKELGKEDAFYDNFRDYKSTLETFYLRDSIKLRGISNTVKIRTYVLDDKGQKQYIAGNIALGDEQIDIPEEGFTKLLFAKGAGLEGKILNKDKTASTLYLEENFSLDFDAPAYPTMVVDIDIQLKEGILVAGVVNGFKSDSSRIGAEPGVTISAEGMDDIETDENGRFQMWLEKDADEVELTLKKDGFNDIKWAFTTKTKTQEERLRAFAKKEEEDESEYTTVEQLRDLNLAIYQRDTSIPDFKTLQGFNVYLESIARIDDDTYLISGSIDLSEEESIFELDPEEELTFKDIEVEADEYNEQNAVLLDDDIDLEQETLNLKLFKYAKVESNNEFEGYTNNIKLVKLKSEGRESYGKIGGVQLKFVPDKILKKDADPIFQEFKLVPDAPEEQGEVGLNDDITAGNQAKLDKERAAAEKAAAQKVIAQKLAAKKAAAKTAPKTAQKTTSNNSKKQAATKATKTASKTTTTKSSSKKEVATKTTSKTNTKSEGDKKEVAGKSDKKEPAADEKEGEGEKKEPEEPKKYQGQESEEPIIPVFVSGGKKLVNFNEDLEYKLVYPEDVNGIERRDEKDSKGQETGRKERIKLGLGLGFGVLLNESKKAKLSKDGVEFIGDLAFPMMAKIGLEGKMPVVERLLLAPNANLPVRELRFAKPTPPDSVKNAKPYYVRLGVANSWRFEVDKLQVFDDFTSAGFGGKLYTDKTNHLIVHSMAVRKANGAMYPFFDMEFPEKGFKIKSIVLKSPEDQHISLGYNFEDEAYEMDAGVRIETAKKPTGAMAKVLPLEVERFVYNTAGKFYLAIKLDKAIEIGPIKLMLRKVSFNRGGAVSWPEMLQALRRDSSETAELNKTQLFNNVNYKTIKSKAVASRNANISNYEVEQMEEDEDVEIEEGEVDWAFGFAGGVQFQSLKGFRCKTDASFVFGERDGEFAIEFNSIDVVVETATFKGFVTLSLSTGGDRVGFEGKGEIETIKIKFGASLKYYKIPDGIEFGVTFKVSTLITTGPVTWTSVGGGIDINTATQKYTLILLGSATPTGTSPEVTELRNIRVEVIFETQACGALPVVKGSGDLFLKNKLYCKGKVLLDFCRLILLLHIECEMELMNGIEAEVRATVYITTGSVFLGANVKAVILGMNANAVFMIGYNCKFAGANVPREVSYYRDLIDEKFLVNGNTLSGFFVGAKLFFSKEASGDYIIFKWGARIAISNDVGLFVSFAAPVFQIFNDFSLEIEAYAEAGYSPISMSAYGFVAVRIYIGGGRNEVDGWNLRGAAALTIEVGNDRERDCNTFGIDWKWFIPVGIKWKFCLDKGIQVEYKQYGGGWSFSF